jgi:hypothetical protein
MKTKKDEIKAELKARDKLAKKFLKNFGILFSIFFCALCETFAPSAFTKTPHPIFKMVVMPPPSLA